MRDMKKAWLVCLALAAGGAVAAPPEVPPAQGKFLRGSNAVPGEYVVVLAEEPSASLPPMAQVANAMARQYSVEVFRTYQHALRGFAMRATEAQARALAADPRVASVQENSTVELAGNQANPPWGLDRIDQRDLPLNSVFEYDDPPATPVHAYIVDSGIHVYHNDFEGRANLAFDATGGDGTDCSPMGHGTGVAGIVGGAQHGVAKGVRLYSVRVTTCQSGTNGALIVSGLDWVAANAQRPAVVNLSFAFQADSAVDAAAQRLIDAGIVLVAAAGNRSPTTDACSLSPARVPGVITVAATNNADARWTSSTIGSNFGPCVDLFAPGENIPSANNAHDFATFNYTGTSFAAPHVAGAAAILLGKGVPAAEIANRLVQDATGGKVTNAGAGSPNRLLHIRPDMPSLSNNVPVTVSDSVVGGRKNFYMDVPAGLSSVRFSITGGTGDADLYVRFNQLPDTFAYDCRPLRTGNEEICTITSPPSGRWYVQLRAYRAYSGVTLRGAY